MTATRTIRRAMTLLELLAATVILSAVAAAGAVILRDVRGAAAHAELTGTAAKVMERWQASREQLPAESAAEQPEWTYLDHRQRLWRIRIDPAAHINPPESNDAPSDQPITLEWDLAVVEYRAQGEHGFEQLTTLRTPLPKAMGKDAPVKAAASSSREGAG